MPRADHSAASWLNADQHLCAVRSASLATLRHSVIVDLPLLPVGGELTLRRRLPLRRRPSIRLLPSLIAHGVVQFSADETASPPLALLPLPSCPSRPRPHEHQAHFVRAQRAGLNLPTGLVPVRAVGCQRVARSHKDIRGSAVDRKSLCALVVQVEWTVKDRKGSATVVQHDLCPDATGGACAAWIANMCTGTV
jgi:hypothetical protein